MDRLVALARSEIDLHRNLLLAAFLAGVATPVLALATRQDQLVLAAALGMAFALGIAILVGGSTLVSALSENRLGFYLTQPVSGAALYLGKMIGVTVLAVLTALLVIAPSGLWKTFAPTQGDSDVYTIVAVGFLALAPLAALAHAAALMLRSGSRWFLLDLAGLLLVGGVGFAIYRTLRSLGAGASLRWLAVAAPLLVVTAAVAAGLTATQRAGALKERAHRVLAIVFWAPLLLAVAILGLWIARGLAISPARLTTLAVHRPPSGSDWVAVKGLVRGWLPGEALGAELLWHPPSGRWLTLAGPRVRDDLTGPSHASFSVDGRWVSWVEERSATPGISVLELTAERATEPKLIQLDDTVARRLAEGHAAQQVSPDGSKIALWEPSPGVRVFESRSSGRPGTPPALARPRPPSLIQVIDVDGSTANPGGRTASVSRARAFTRDDLAALFLDASPEAAPADGTTAVERQRPQEFPEQWLQTLSLAWLDDHRLLAAGCAVGMPSRQLRLSTVVAELDLDTGRWTRQPVGDAGCGALSLDPREHRLLLLDPRRATVVDLGEGPTAGISTFTSKRNLWAGSLTGDAIVLISFRGNSRDGVRDRRVDVVELDGSLRGSVVLDDRFELGPEVEPGRFLLLEVAADGREEPTVHGYRWLEIGPQGPRLSDPFEQRPARYDSRSQVPFWQQKIAIIPQAGSASTRTLVGADGRLLRIDPDSTSPIRPLT